MKQSSVLLVVFILMTLFCGGFIVYDIVQNERLNGINGPNNSTNWDWEDNWNPSQPVRPQQPTQPNQPVRPQPQQPDRPLGQIVASNYQDAVAQSRQYGMPILVYFEADWCGWCKKMKSETLNSSAVKEVMTNYILVYVNADRDRQIVQQFGVSGLPSYVITNSRSINLKSGKGYKNASKFAEWLNDPSMFQQPKDGPRIDPQPEPERRDPWPRNRRS